MMRLQQTTTFIFLRRSIFWHDAKRSLSNGSSIKTPIDNRVWEGAVLSVEEKAKTTMAYMYNVVNISYTGNR